MYNILLGFGDLNKFVVVGAHLKLNARAAKKQKYKIIMLDIVLVYSLGDVMKKKLCLPQK